MSIDTLYNHQKSEEKMFKEPFIIVKRWRQSTPMKKQKTINRTAKYKNCWKIQEHRGYLQFFRENIDFSTSHQKRKIERIFVSMKKYIPTRTAIQIKSHHQKMLKKFGSIETILKKLEHLMKLEESKLRNRSETYFPQEQGLQAQEPLSETSRSKLSSTLSFNNDDIYDILDLSSSENLMMESLS